MLVTVEWKANEVIGGVAGIEGEYDDDGDDDAMVLSVKSEYHALYRAGDKKGQVPLLSVLTMLKEEETIVW